MHLLLASIAPLVLGPVLVWLLQRARWAARAIDAFVLVSVAGLVLLSILPEAIGEAGLAAVIAVIVGTTLPMLGGKIFSAKPAVRSATLLAGMLGLALHATLDGVALAAHGHGHDHAGAPLAFAVLLHRLPVGLAIWWLVRPRLGIRVALGSVGAIVIASVMGFLWAHEAHEWMHGPALATFQALVAGSLLHVAVGHSVAPEKPGRKEAWRIASAVGGLLGIAIVVVLAQAHPLPHVTASSMGFGDTFMTLARRSAPALLAAYAVSALFHIVLPKRYGAWLRGRSALSQAFRGVSAGASADTCACTINPRYETLVRGGVPPSAAIAFLVAAPVLGIASVLVSFRLLGTPLSLALIAAAAGLAVLVGALLGRVLTRVSGNSLPAPPHASTAWATRLRDGLHYGFIDVPDRTLPWFVAGSLAAALLEPMLDPTLITFLPAHVDVPVLALLGMPIFISALGATPFALVLVHKGVSAGAVVALLLTAPATNASTFGLLRQLHGRKVAIAFGVVMIAAAIGLGYTVNLALPAIALPLQAWPPSHFDDAALALLGLVALWSLLRQGAHGFVSQVVELHHHFHHDHGHDHEHEHGHEHEHEQGPEHLHAHRTEN